MLNKKVQLKDILDQITGQLSFSNPKTQESRRGSAILLTKDLIITPAYNIWDRSSQRQYECHQFCPKQVEDNNSYEIQESYFMQGYKNEKKQPYSKMHNYGLMRLSQPSKGISLCDILLKNIEKSANYQSQQTLNMQIISQIKQHQLLPIEQINPSTNYQLLQNQKAQQFVQSSAKQINKDNKVEINLNTADISTIHPINSPSNMSLNKDISFQSTYLLKPSNSLQASIYSFEQNLIKCINSNLGRNKQIIVGGTPLKRAQQLTLKVQKYGSKSSKIIVGVLSKNINDNSHKNSKRIFQFESNRYDRLGKIRVNEQKINKSTFSPFIEAGQQLSLLFDFNKKQVSIWLSTDNIPLNYSDDDSNQFYPFIELSSKQDTIQLRIKSLK